MYNKEQWDTFREMFDTLEDLAFEYVNEFGNKDEDITGVSIDGTLIIIKTEENWNFGGHDTDEHHIPLRYAYTKNWMEEEREEKEKLRILTEKGEHDRIIAKRNKEIADEQAKYLELKAKYGDNNEIE